MTRQKKAPAYWQTTPCPPWCVGPHRDSDHPTEREHQGLYFSTPLTETKPEQYGPNLAGETFTFQPPPLMACLIQHVRYAVPNIEMCVGDGEVSATVTLDEAEQIAGNLTELIAQGRGTPPVQTPAEGCAPWCAHHADLGACWSEAIVTIGGDVDLAYTEDDGVRVNLAGELDGLTVEQAEQLAHAILKQTAIARGIAPSSS